MGECVGVGGRGEGHASSFIASLSIRALTHVSRVSSALGKVICEVRCRRAQIHSSPALAVRVSEMQAGEAAFAALLSQVACAPALSPKEKSTGAGGGESRTTQMVSFSPERQE